MKVRILQEFHDINDFAKVFQVDTEAEFADERAEGLISRGLVVSLDAEENEEQADEHTDEVAHDADGADKQGDAEEQAAEEAEENAEEQADLFEQPAPKRTRKTSK